MPNCNKQNRRGVVREEEKRLAIIAASTIMSVDSKRNQEELEKRPFWHRRLPFLFKPGRASCSATSRWVVRLSFPSLLDSV